MPGKFQEYEAMGKNIELEGNRRIGGIKRDSKGIEGQSLTSQKIAFNTF